LWIVQVLTGLTKFTLEKWALIACAAFLWVAIMLVPVSGFPLINLGLADTIVIAIVVYKIEHEEVEFLKNNVLLYSVWHNTVARVIVVLIGGS